MANHCKLHWQRYLSKDLKAYPIQTTHEKRSQPFTYQGPDVEIERSKPRKRLYIDAAASSQ